MTEQQIQKEIFQYFQNKYCLKNQNPKCSIFAVPNGGSRNMLEAINLKATGVVAGVADLIILMPNAKTIFVEVKTEKGIQSDKQKDFEKTVTDLGFKYYLVRSLEEFKNLPL